MCVFLYVVSWQTAVYQTAAPELRLTCRWTGRARSLYVCAPLCIYATVKGGQEPIITVHGPASAWDSCELQTQATSAPWKSLLSPGVKLFCSLLPSETSGHVMHTENSIKRRLFLRQLTGGADGLLPSSACSSIASLKLLYRHRSCALNEFTSRCWFFFPPLMHASALLSCVWFISTGRRKES